MTEVMRLPLSKNLQVGTEAFSVGQAKLNAIINYGTKIMDWPLVEEAIDAKIEDQIEFVRWWDEKVGAGHGAGRGNKKNADHASFLSKEEAEAQTRVTQPQVSRWRKSIKDRTKYREKLILAAYRKADLTPAENHRAEGSGENEWYTPEKYIEAAREVMGEIDLDPATSVTAQHTVRAERFYTQQDDGLDKQWEGRVWLNPPYAQPLIGQFVDKLVSEYAAGRVTKAVVLTHNYTDTAWFHMTAGSASAICFTRGRIGFLNPDGEKASATQGQAFFYFGNEIDIFADVFGRFGLVLLRHA